jgi:Short repeat of unknown function (DUF308)
VRAGLSWSGLPRVPQDGCAEPLGCQQRQLNLQAILVEGMPQGLLGLILIFYGTFEIIQGVASRAVNPYWWLGLILGILLVLLAFWVSGSDRVYALAQRTYLILFWVGFFALFRGFSQIFMAFTVRHAGQEAAAALGDTPGPR